MIRLTLFLTAGIVGAMLVFGTEDPDLARAEIAATVVETVTAVAETAPETRAAQDLLFVTGSRVNLRAGPSTGHAVLRKLGLGDVAVLLGPGPEGWTRIRDIETGAVGFMSSDFLSPRDPAG